MLRRRRLLRVHLEGSTASVQGIYVGWWANHLVLRIPQLVEAEGRTVDLDGRDVKIPRARILFMQEL